MFIFVDTVANDLFHTVMFHGIHGFLWGSVCVRFSYTAYLPDCSANVSYLHTVGNDSVYGNAIGF